MVEAKNDTGITLFTLKIFLVTLIGIALFLIYVNILMYGDNSLTILNELKEKKKSLIFDKKSLKIENQRLQKEYFELKQLEPKE